MTYVARNLEPYRGFHIFMRALPRILARQDVVVSIVGGDGISYGAPPAQGGTWRATMLHEMGDRLDPARVHFLGKVPYAQHLALLQRSDAHVYLSYPFVASWSLREAFACGCAVIGNDTETVTEFLQHGENGRVVPTLDPTALADEILRLLEDRKMSRHPAPRGAGLCRAKTGSARLFGEIQSRHRRCLRPAFTGGRKQSLFEKSDAKTFVRLRPVALKPARPRLTKKEAAF